MQSIRRRTIDSSIEKKIAISMITSTDFLNLIHKTLILDNFKIDYVKRIARWCLEYWKEYKEAPQRHIQDIYDVEKEDMSAPEQNNVETFLINLSEEYENEQLNVDYIINQAKEYFRVRGMERICEQGNKLLSIGKIDQAEKALNEWKDIKISTTKTGNMMNREEVGKTIIQDDSNYLFIPNGKLGEYLGGLERSWLMSIAAPEKRGKSFMLEEFAFQVLENKLKVLFVSLEMNDITLKRRFYSRITGKPYSRSDVVKNVKVAVFDCLNNQDDSCEKPQRANKHMLLDDDSNKPEFSSKNPYRICTYCRDKGLYDYIPAHWFEWIGDAKPYTTKDVLKKVEVFKKLYGDNLRYVCFPAFSANSVDINEALNELEYTENFIVDVLIVDYIDILAPEDNNLSERGNIDCTWKKFKNIAASRNCLVITAEQSNKASNDRISIKVTDVSEDKRKNAHVDLKISLNQLSYEQKEGVTRINTLLHRHGSNQNDKQCMVLQSFELGLPMLDSEIVYPPRMEDVKNNKKKTKKIIPFSK